MIKVAIYSGVIPSSTFINELIDEIAAHHKQKFKLLIHGKILHSNYSYASNVVCIGYKGGVKSILSLIKYFILALIFTPKGLRIVFRHLENQTNLINKYYYLLRALPFLYHKPDIFHLQWTTGIGDWIWLKELGVKVIVSFRGAGINIEPLSDNKLAENYKRYLPLCDSFHSVSKALSFEASKYGADINKNRVIFTAVDKSKIPVVSEKLQKAKTLQIISVGRPHWKKGYHYAIDACFLLKKSGFGFKYTIIGGFSQETVFQVSQLGLTDRVVLLPLQSHSHVLRLMAEAHILLLPSVEEGIANVAIEAMLAKTFVIATNSGGMSEVIFDNNTGFLIKVRSTNDIAEAIMKFQRLNEADKNLIINNAYNSALNQFSLSRLGNEMCKLYEDTLNNKL
jgi:glycosyltransferase involved in cell wall biosynthesis